MSATMIGKTRQCTYRSTYSRNSHSIRSFEPTDRDLFWEDNPRATYTPTSTNVVSSVELFRTGSEEVPQVERSKPALLWRCFFRMATISFPGNELAKLLYSVSEAAQLLSCSRNTVYELMRSGQILAVYPTSKARIPATALLRFVQSKEVEARAVWDSSRRLAR